MMWLRRIFGQGETPEDAPPAESQQPVQQASNGTPASEPAESAAGPSEAPQAPIQPVEDVAASVDAAGETAASAQVSPPGHAPQGLAAEPAARTPDLVPGADPPAHLRDEVAHTLETTGAEQALAGDEIAGATPGENAPSTDAELSIPTFEVPELAVPSFAPAEEAPAAEQTAEAAPQEAPATVPDATSQPPAEAPASEPTETAPAAEAMESAAAPETPQATPAAAATAVPQSPHSVPEAATAPEEPASAGQIEAAAGEAPVAQVEAPDSDTTSEPTAEVAVPAAFGPLEPGTVVAGRYTIKALAEGAGPDADTLVYIAVDERSYERCWSCGSSANNANTRFCQNCGAPIQGHQVTLVQTHAATDEPGELEQDGAYFHVQPERRKFGAEGMGLEIGAHSAEGPHHPNEDSYWYTTRALCANSGRLSTGIAVFADGMGGYAPGSGLISSRIVASVGKSILAALDERVDMPGTLDETEAETIMRQAIATANAMVLDEIAHTGEMGATLVTVMIHGDTAYVANIGDSRAYYIDPHGRTTVITRDQSLVAEQVQMGHLAENDVYTAPGNNIILHAIGEEGVQDAADWYAQPLEPGSYLLVCSDGYWKTLRGAVMPEGVLRESDTLAEAARRMVDDALAQGSDDNTTLMLIAIS